MTTPLNDADERRLVDAVATAWYGGVTDHWRRDARMVIGRMRDQKITLTIEPEPEPVYVLRIPEHRIVRYRAALTIARIRPGTENEATHENMLSALWGELDRATPEER